MLMDLQFYRWSIGVLSIQCSCLQVKSVNFGHFDNIYDYSTHVHNINSSFSNIMMFCLNTFQMSNKILPDFYSVWKYLKRKTVMALQREWSKLLVPDRTNIINYENYESGESHWGCSKWTSWGAMHVARLIEILIFTQIYAQSNISEI